MQRGIVVRTGPDFLAIVIPQYIEATDVGVADSFSGVFEKEPDA